MCKKIICKRYFLTYFHACSIYGHLRQHDTGQFHSAPDRHQSEASAGMFCDEDGPVKRDLFKVLKHAGTFSRTFLQDLKNTEMTSE